MMKPEDIQNALGDIGEDLIEEAANFGNVTKKRVLSKWKWIPAIAAILAVAIAVGMFLSPGEKTFLISAAQYPSASPYPHLQYKWGSEEYKQAALAWKEERVEKKRLFESISLDLDSFLQSTVQELLSNTNGKNTAYSPLNIYLALCMTAEITDGKSREEILDLLGVADIESMREQVNALWRSHYSNDGIYTLTLANSLWLNENVKFRKETIKQLTESYFASAFQGEMGNEEYTQALRNWLNEQTNGLLNNDVDSIHLDPDTILALVSTIYFQAKWVNKFYEKNNETFYTANGEVSCIFMKRNHHDYYYCGENFSAVKCEFDQINSGMWLILPDEGVAMESVLCDEDFHRFLKDPTAQSSIYEVDLSLPMFDFACKTDLSESLKNLGIESVFTEKADFSPLAKNTEGISLNKIEHNVRIAIDEEGCTATAYTVEYYEGMAPIDEKVTLKFDRPFFFLVTSQHNTPLFAGVVNDPTAS
ncbi:MAG: hypothetical protein IKA05_05295 [Clostridia bacterium]|nr:hypothetical protein [Clostridia bacterium]